MCPIGGVVVDPFAGSGSSLAVALVHRYSAVGIEASERFCEVIADRLRRLGEQGELFAFS